ncbi:alkaline phosphatase family protein [Danxiaibacter flavus]|uniref:Alkaline phosphatase family protein n=1 Tax=Danxiaibacter flavus TaxID=3049108 RepID=A0ABV3Z9E5_9BACT|nr:alkaline phosphatase family protein [Chitinophagaceae bacterium DXS]
MKLRYLLLLGFQVMFARVAFTQKGTASQSQNLVVITFDGVRWHEIFKGADLSLLKDKKFNSSDSLLRIEKYWSDEPGERRSKLMPFLWNYIVKNGQLYGNRDAGNFVNVKNPYWFSYPGRSESFCGYVDTAVNSNDFPDNPNTNVFEFINQQPLYKGKVAGFASWNVVAHALNRNRSGMYVNVAYEEIKGDKLTPLEQFANETQRYEPTIFGASERVDASTFMLTKAYIQAKHPKVIYIDLGDTDEYAHEGHYDKYLDAIHNCDAMISSLWNYMQGDAFYKNNTSFVVVPDHGRGEGDKWTDHGSKTPHSNDTWILTFGAGIKHSGEIKAKGQLYNEQFAQTIAGLLGLRFNATHPVAPAIDGIIK